LFVDDKKPEPMRARRNEAAKARFLEGLATMRRGALEAAKAILEVDRDAHFLYEGCASIGEFGERHGASAGEARRLVSMGRALDVCPDLESRVKDGRVALEGAALLGRVLGDPTLMRPGDDWLRWAETESARDLRRRVDRRVEDARLSPTPSVGLTVFVSPKGLDDFGRARAIASRKAERTLTEGEAFETVVGHYLDSFDPDRRGTASRRLPHTSTVPGRYVPADVQRVLRARDGDRCALPFCDHAIFLENAHVVAHAKEGDREADNLLRLCAKHHRMLDEGKIRVTGPADAPQFSDAEGRPLDRRGQLPPGSGERPGPRSPSKRSGPDPPPP